MTPSAVDLSPLLRLALMAGVGALLPLAWWWLRQRGADTRTRLAALTALTLFLTFDLIVFGAFTRLTDSGLGCPDWPGCYGEAHPLAAHEEILAAQTAMPTGPVTVAKAWIEMIHRYLAMVVGVLILVAAAVSWRARRALPHSPWWPVATLVWVIVQGLFGKYTVTLKLYPAIVTLHLLGAMVLLALLVQQHESFRDRPLLAASATGRRGPSPWFAGAVLAVVLVQVALGGWVSTNYAVMACSGFPTCNGQWWPAADMAHGFTLLRELGRAGHGGFLPFEALVAIHLVHRAFALVAFAALLALAWVLHRHGGVAQRRYALALLALVLAQAGSGLSNVVLGWPIAGALAHSGGAAALVGVLTSLLARVRAGQAAPASSLNSAGRTQRLRTV
ncbi:COX15/CtaA family protein [Ideonella sp. DXS22W]|uniref:COX15/CtaA family protein n=1 Tax=Pseudaquabacterium inlustre TaxID=2984192 RepID=A0ABU9CGI7_9BURK